MKEMVRTKMTQSVMLVDKYKVFLENLKYFTVGKVNLAEGEEVPWEGGLALNHKRGKIGTRMSKWLREKHDIKLDAGTLSLLITDLTNALTPTGIEVEINNRFTWNPGDFSDGKSCFFGGKRQCLPRLYHLGGMAMKVYDGDTGKGMGRCLLLDDSSNFTILFNAYGMELERLAALHGYLTRSAGQYITANIEGTLRINGASDHPIWINKGRGLAQVTLAVEDGKVDLSKLPEPSFRHDGKQVYDVRGNYNLYCELCYELLDHAGGWKDRTGRRMDHHASVCMGDCMTTVSQSLDTKWSTVEILGYIRMKDRKEARREEPKRMVADWIMDMDPPPYRVEARPRQVVFLTHRYYNTQWCRNHTTHYAALQQAYVRFIAPLPPGGMMTQANISQLVTNLLLMARPEVVNVNRYRANATTQHEAEALFGLLMHRRYDMVEYMLQTIHRGPGVNNNAFIVSLYYSEYVSHTAEISWTQQVSIGSMARGMASRILREYGEPPLTMLAEDEDYVLLVRLVTEDGVPPDEARGQVLLALNARLERLEGQA
jgi:hypothetical protein